MSEDRMTPEQRKARIREIEARNHAAGLHTSRVETCSDCAALATPPVPAWLTKPDGVPKEAWDALMDAEVVWTPPVPDGDEREQHDLETQLVLRAGHLPTCGEGAEFPWDCTCDYAGFMDRMGRVLARLTEGGKHPEEVYAEELAEMQRGPDRLTEGGNR